MKKSIGIIGGLGPLATVKFVEILNELIPNDSNIEMVIINDPTTPDRTAYILDKTKENPKTKILEMVKKLEISNVDVIVMPCNTASYFYNEIINATKIPFINIALETTKFLARNNFKKVGLLATKGTVESKIYEDLLKKENIECITPNDIGQEIISQIIYDGIKSGKKIDMDKFYNVSNNLIDNGVEAIILGCTELSVLKKIENINDKIFVDAMEVLATSTINFIENIVNEKS